MAIKIFLLSMIAQEKPAQRLTKQPRTAIHHFIILVACTLLLQGCAVTMDALSTLPLMGSNPDSIEKNFFLVDKEEDIIGKLATIRLNDGDTLPDIARHFSLGLNTLSAANPKVDVWVPKAGERIVLPLSYTLPRAPKKGIVINLAAMRLFEYRQEGNMMAVSTFPVGVGTAERPTPMGRMYITRKKERPTWYVPASIAADHRKKGDPLPAIVPPGPLNPLGDHALYLSRSSYLIHGTNKPASIGLRATNGCIRLYPEDIKQLFETTPQKTPVRIVNQPYLIGQRDGVVYLEAHTPFEESGGTELKKIYARLKKIEKKTGQALDWQKLKNVVTEARGIPMTITAAYSASEPSITKAIKLRHPGDLYGQPKSPEVRTDAWYVLAAIMDDRVDARRLSAIINHQGPPIPSRVLSKGGKHRVLAGPFNNKGEAKRMAKRLRIDLELDGILVPPT